MANVQSILDTIRANASEEYRTRIPEATQTSINAVGDALGKWVGGQNEFLDMLVERIALTLVNNRTFKNPLQKLKKGGIPLGSGIQDLYTNIAKDVSGNEGETLFTEHAPDTKALYYRRNRESQYCVTIKRSKLLGAFVNASTMEKFIGDIVTTLYSGDSYDEFNLSKQLISDAITNNRIVTSNINMATTNASHDLLKEIQKISKAMTYPNSQFNSYKKIYEEQNSGKTIDPVVTWTPLENQILIIRSDVLIDINMDDLANVYNLEKSEIRSKIVEVDNFLSSDCLALICDEHYFQIYDNLNELTSFYNPKSLSFNYYWNHWQTYDLSHFCNAVALMNGNSGE